MTRRGYSDPTKNAFSLADIDLLGWEINVGAELGDAGIRCDCRGEAGRNRQLCAANIEGIQERLMMKECRIIDVESYIANQRQCVLMVLEIENSDVLCD